MHVLPPHTQGTPLHSVRLTHGNVRATEGREARGSRSRGWPRCRHFLSCRAIAAARTNHGDPAPAAATGVREQEAARQIKARPSVNKDSDEIALWLHGSAG